MHETIKIIISFDFGMKRIGTAIGQTVTQTTRPLQLLKAKEGHPDWQTLKNLILKWHPQAFVVGIPFNMDGTEQTTTHKAREFAGELRAMFQLPVFEIDERLTTKAAREHLFSEGGYKALQDGQVDCVAAQFILQNWLTENYKK